MGKTLKMLLVTVVLFLAIWVYNNVFLDVSKRNQQLFTIYFANQVKDAEEYYLKSNNINGLEEFLNIIPDEIKNLKTKEFLQELNKNENLKEKYILKLKEIVKENECTLEEFVEVELNSEIELADKYKLTISEKELITKLTTIAKEALEDKEVLELCEKVFTKKHMEILESLNKDYIENNEKIDADKQVTIAVYVKNAKPLKTDFINEQGKFSIQIADIDGEKNLQLSIK